MGYILTVAILNLGLGFALAWHVGRSFRAATVVDWHDEPPAPAPRVAEPADSDPADEIDIASLLSGLGEDAEEGGETAREETAAEETAFPEPEPPKEKDTRPIAVGALQDVGRRFHEHLLETESWFRENSAECDEEAIGEKIVALVRWADDYVTQGREALAIFEAFRPDAESFKPHNREMESLIKLQAKTVRDAKNVLEHLNLEDGETASQRVLALIYDMYIVNDRLRDALHAATASIVRIEQSTAEAAETLGTDVPSELPNLIGLEVELMKWWQKDLHRARPLALIAWEVDEVGRLNRQYGYPVVSRLLAALGHCLAEQLGDEVPLARTEGTQFVAFLTDEEAADAVDLLERSRQTVELIRFHSGEEEIAVTVSCAATEATAEDTIVSLMARLDVSLAEARRSGRNRTFHHDGARATSVVPPNLTLTGKTVEL